MSTPENHGLTTMTHNEFENPGIASKRLYFDYRRLLIKILKPTEFVILEALNLRANPKNDGWCWPTLQTIAEDTGITSLTTIVSAIKRLKELEILEVARKKTLFYRPVSPSCELITKLAFLVTALTDAREMMESNKVSKNETSKFQNLEETVTKNGSLEFQILEPNKSNGIVTNLTNQTNENDKESKTTTLPNIEILAADTNKPLDLDRLKEDYLKAQARQEVHRHQDKDTADVLGEAFRYAFDYPPDTDRLLKMAQVQMAGDVWSLIETILNLSGKKLWEDPHTYLQKVVCNKQHQKQSGDRNEYGTGQFGKNYKGYRQNNRPERTVEEIRREFSTFKLPGS